MISTIEPSQKLHWTQRVALVRHNLHSARRTGDFTFFKALQAHALIDGTDHVAILHSILGDDADSVVSTLDNLNAGIAYVHQDAFKAVYDSAKATMYKAGSTSSSRKSLLQVDISQQWDMADHAIDKTSNSAINLIEQQPAHCQDAVANAWITGMTIISDAVCVCLKEMEAIEGLMDDYIRLEYSWNSIQSCVDAAVSALRGIFNLMATSSDQNSVRTMSVSSEAAPPVPRGRTMSVANGLGMIKSAFTQAQSTNPTPLKNSPYAPGTESTSRSLRMSMSAACPTRIPNFSVPNFQHTYLSTIPPTPAAVQPSTKQLGDTKSPFKEKDDYFAFDLDARSSDIADMDDSGNQDSLMHVESLDPLQSPNKPLSQGALTLRRLSDVFGISTPPSIASG